MCSVRQWLSLIVAVGFGSFLSPQLAWPLLYQCREANGGTIFTDSTAQLQHCLAINMGTAARLSYPVGTAAGSSASPVASAGPEPPSVPVSSDLLEKPAPVPSAEDDALPGRRSHPPCFAGINPLNPFAGRGCAPTENTVTVQPDLPPEPGNDGSPP